MDSSLEKAEKVIIFHLAEFGPEKLVDLVIFYMDKIYEDDMRRAFWNLVSDGEIELDRDWNASIPEILPSAV